MDEKTKEALQKVADYGNDEKLAFLKRINLLFWIAIAAFVVYAVLEYQGLTSTGIYEDIASFALGLDFGMLLVGVLFTSRYALKIKAAKQRLLKKMKR